MTTDELHVLANGRRMGLLTRHRQRDTLRLDYDPEWLGFAGAFPLSLSMPLAAASHGDAVVEPFLAGLLPDNNAVLQRWGERFGVSPRHAFKLITHVGEDCAGAVQFVTRERAETLLTHTRQGSVQWLSRAEVADRIRLLLQDHSAARLGSDQGRFSLAGAQPKTALLFDAERGRWGVPSGANATTHILKPATGQFDAYAENEHFCMTLARNVGLSAATSTIERFGEVSVFVTERYDRMRRGRTVLRIHQEDSCQALAKSPHTKYQNEGGPGPSDIVRLIRRHSSAKEDDEVRFLDALLFHWLIAGTDAHAKNYSFLISGGNHVRLAPLYDLASALPYPQQIPPRRATLAMKIGGKYRLHDVGIRQWQKAAVELSVDTALVRARLATLAGAMPEATGATLSQLRADGVGGAMSTRLATSITTRARSILGDLPAWR